jgi:uncharacterized protein
MHEPLPLFPLNTVLFPGVSLTLHIFEDRYRLMIRNCLEKETPFGILFVQDTTTVSELSLVRKVGTIAQINANVRLEDGRYLIATVGQHRFRVHEALQRAPYFIATIELLPEEQGARLGPIARQLRHTYDNYWRSVASATGTHDQAEDLPTDDVSMAYQLAHRMQVTTERKQRWLEVDFFTRTNEIMTMLQAEMSLLPRRGNDDAASGMRWPWSWN